MEENQKLLTKKFLHAAKSAIMAMDIETLKDDQLAEVFATFSALVTEISPKAEDKEK